MVEVLLLEDLNQSDYPIRDALMLWRLLFGVVFKWENMLIIICLIKQVFFITNGYSALLCLAVVMNRVQGATKDLIKNNIGDPSPKSPCLLSLYLLGSNVIRKLQQIIIVTGAVNCNSKTVMMTY